MQTTITKLSNKDERYRIIFKVLPDDFLTTLEIFQEGLGFQYELKGKTLRLCALGFEFIGALELKEIESIHRFFYYHIFEKIKPADISYEELEPLLLQCNAGYLLAKKSQDLPKTLADSVKAYKKEQNALELSGVLIRERLKAAGELL